MCPPPPTTPLPSCAANRRVSSVLFVAVDSISNLPRLRYDYQSLVIVIIMNKHTCVHYTFAFLCYSVFIAFSSSHVTASLLIALNVAVQWAAVLLHVMDVVISNFSPKFGYPDSVPAGKF
jgi:hypothetical protein